MAASKEPPLDETVWANPQWAGMVQPNNVLNYFLTSPFFDRSSNNASLYMQAQNQQNLFFLLNNRAEFEARLKTMVGTEFVVSMEDPSQGVYIIKKQLRRSADDAVPLEAYFIIGENIIMAPTVYSVLMNRMLSSLTLISKAHNIAASLSKFTPEAGYSYPDSTQQQASGSSQSQVPLSQQSVASTPAPAAGPDSAETKSAQQRKEEHSLLQSLSLSLRYAAGQPGGFLDDNNITDPQAIMVSTSAPASQQAHGQSQGGSQGSSGGGGGGGGAGGPPKLDIKTKDTKGKAGTANSPASPTSPTTGTGTLKKRRKSKAAGALAAAAAAAAEANAGS